MAENATERVLRYLTDSHAAEVGGLESLQDLAKQATDPDVRAVVTEHISVTQSQIDRLHTRIGALGGKDAGGKDAGGKNLLNSVIAKGSNLVNAFHDTEDKQTQDVIKAYSFEHFEIGAYTSLQSYASAVGDTETAQIAASIIQEENLAAEKLFALIPQVAVAALSKTYGEGAAAV